MDRVKVLGLLILLLFTVSCHALCLARLKYDGGGDWYNDQEALPNLAREIITRTGIMVKEKETVVSASDQELFEQKFFGFSNGVHYSIP